MIAHNIYTHVYVCFLTDDVMNNVTEKYDVNDDGDDDDYHEDDLCLFWDFQ